VSREPRDVLSDLILPIHRAGGRSNRVADQWSDSGPTWAISDAGVLGPAEVGSRHHSDDRIALRLNSAGRNAGSRCVAAASSCPVPNFERG
jgi:hypothetical protein